MEQNQKSLSDQTRIPLPNELDELELPGPTNSAPQQPANPSITPENPDASETPSPSPATFLIPDYLQSNESSQPQEMPPPRKKESLLGSIIAGLAVAGIIILAFLLYYYGVRNYQSPAPSYAPSDSQQPVSSVAQEPQQVVPETPTNATKVIAFTPPLQLPEDSKSGSCWIHSLAQPYRTDAWRCVVGATIYDPCFTTSDPNLVFCQMNPVTGMQFTIALQKPLPDFKAGVASKDNWAWFLTLADGTGCAPFTDDRPTVDGEEVVYGCRASDKNHQILIVGELMKDTVWTAKEAVLELKGSTWAVTSVQLMDVTSVWQ